MTPRNPRSLILTRVPSGPAADRNEWIWTLQQVVEERKGKAPERTSLPSATAPADKSGFLELRGFKHKLFVAVAGDKVFLYKNAEVGGWGGAVGDPHATPSGDPFPPSPQHEQT